MRLSTQIKPISYVKANAAEIIAELNDGGAPIVITQNGEAKAVLQDVREYERTQETLALLKILALGMEDVRTGRVLPAREALEGLRDEILTR
ncbi:type II toxin-antitoxin system Phd/YefM family antitoxin [Sphingomonas sp. 1P08PE]|uniref:type II toxin-antitoxin system Phd/YefM family antitoxin n=1 Tax=Sphingomonas sp. 1P08PE TaxID=554122 RepID=UPI0039A3F5E8